MTPYKPTVNNRASICEFDLKIRFLTKEQCQKFINAYLETVEYPCDMRYTRRDDAVLVEHIVSITGGQWAKNLAQIAALLEQVDFQL